MRSVLDSAERKDIEEMDFLNRSSLRKSDEVSPAQRELTSRDESSLHLLEL